MKRRIPIVIAVILTAPFVAVNGYPKDLPIITTASASSTYHYLYSPERPVERVGYGGV